MVCVGLAGCTDDAVTSSTTSNSSETTVEEPTAATSVSTTTSTELGPGQPRYVVGFEQYAGPKSPLDAKTLPKSIARYDRLTDSTVVLVSANEIVEGVSAVTILDADVSPDGSSVAFTAMWSDRQRQKDEHNDEIHLSGVFEVPSDGSATMTTLLQTDEPSREVFFAVEYSPDGRRLAIGDGGRLGVLSTETGTVTWSDNAYAGSMAWAPGGAEVAVAMGGSMSCSSVDVIQFRAGSEAFTTPGFGEAGAGPWWDEAGVLHTTVPENTNTRSGCHPPASVAIDTDVTYRWVLSKNGTCWFSGNQPDAQTGEERCTPLSLPNFFDAVSW